MQGISGAPKGFVPTRDVTPPREEFVGAAGAGGLLNVEKDAKEASTEAKFGDLWRNIQSRYGAKPEKPREIKKNLGKDDFLKIMMIQMKHQDPTNPFKADQFATQMAQFTTVEQLQNMNQSMAKLTQGNQPLERLAMTNMIGKVVTIDRERFQHTENTASSLQYDLPRDATSARVLIKNADNGEVIAEKDLGPMKKGLQSYAWNGETTKGLPAKSGNYAFVVEAKDAGGRKIEMQTQGQAPVVGVSFEGQEAILLIGDNRNPQKVTLKNVIRVDTAGPGMPAQPESQAQGLIPGARSLAEASAGATAPSAGAAPKGSNFFTFEKGVGSVPMDESRLPPDARAALQKYESSRAAVAVDAENADGKNSSTDAVEKIEGGGFPNGISSVD